MLKRGRTCDVHHSHVLSNICKLRHTRKKVIGKQQNRKKKTRHGTYLTVTGVTIFSHEVDTMTVLVPEGAFVGQGAVSDSDVIVIVVGGERSTLVVSHGVTWENTDSKAPKLLTGSSFHQVNKHRPALLFCLSVYLSR